MKTSELMVNGVVREATQPRFKVGQTVSILTELGYTGKVVMSEPYCGRGRYLLDCHPGALSGYVWLWMQTADGPDLVALNWFAEGQLTEIT